MTLLSLSGKFGRVFVVLDHVTQNADPARPVLDSLAYILFGDHSCPSGWRAMRTLQSQTVVMSPPVRALSRTRASSSQPAQPSAGVGSNWPDRSGRSTGALWCLVGSVIQNSVCPELITD